MEKVKMAKTRYQGLFLSVLMFPGTGRRGNKNLKQGWLIALYSLILPIIKNRNYF
jgi:hypothetical protein